MEAKAKAIVQTLVDGLNSPYQGSSSMTPSIYDTAWVSMVSKMEGQSRRWLFPQCFESILAAQDTGGGFGALGAEVDTILNTAAALLAMCKHNNTLMLDDDTSDCHLSARIARATAFLQLKLEEWDVKSTIHVGFEVLVPSLLSMLGDEGLQFDFPGLQTLMFMAGNKMSRFSPTVLYSNQRTTFIHSMEALVGRLDFDKVSHHIQNGAMMASPASTAAYLIHGTTWNDEAEAYLGFVVAHGNGKVASAFPISIFEITWILSTLLDHGFSVEDLGIDSVYKLADFLEGELRNQSNTIGFGPSLLYLCHIMNLLTSEAPGILPDADDTAKVIVTMNLLNRPTSCREMINTFDGSSHFRTYANESTPSVSANCNVLIALAQSPDANKYTVEILKALRFLSQLWSRGEMKDKWNLEQQYSVMLLAKAACDVFKLYDAGELPRVPADPILFNLAVTTLQICVRTLSSQDDTGAWKNSCEVSAYAILTLKTLASLPWIRAIIGDEVNRSISSGELFLKAREIEWENPAPIWIEKVSYGSKLLSETYCLAALQATATYTWGGKVAALTKTSMNKVIKFSEFFSRLPLFSDEPFWRLRASVAEGYMMASTLDDPRARSIFPQAKGAVRSKYLDYIPLAWTTCNNANNFGISTQTMREMMIISLLNFQADKYIEDVIANRNLASDIPALQGVIRHILPQDSFDFSSPVYRPNYQQLPDLPLKAHHQNGGYINGGQAPRSLQLFTGEASDSYAHFKFLSDFNDTMHRFVSYIQDHTAVSGSSWSSRRRVTDQLRNFLHAHIKQGEDNLELVRRISGQEKNIILADARTTFYDWVNSTSADHTSCPYSFQFFQCLIAPAAGQSCFEGVLATYIGQDLCRHLASMCRIYNDYGSILRDRKERNLNSVNFSEFHDHSETLHNNGMNCTFATTDEVLRQKLMQVATYERSGLDSAMERLKPKISMKTWKAIQVFVNVTDLFGQVYVVRDINDG